MRFAAIVALLLLSACQPLPHPFAHDLPPPNSAILTPPDSAGVIVEPVAGAPEPAAHDLAVAMAAALQDEDVPASTGAGNRGSYRLSGQATATDLGNGNLSIGVAWEMRDAGGTSVSRTESRLTLPERDWRQGGKSVAALARQPAPVLAKVVESTAPAPLMDTDPVVVVSAVMGAPGDGGQSLTRAMEDALRRAKLASTERPGDKANFVVQGRVEISPPVGGKQQVKISWALLRPDGGQIGQVQQENAVAAGSLDGAWGMTAYDIANAAAPGITALIAELRKGDARS